MSKKKYRSLVYAVALATSIAAVPGVTEAEEATDTTAVAASNAETADAAAPTDEAVATDMPTEVVPASDAEVAAGENEAAPAKPAELTEQEKHMKQWSEVRPTDDLIVEYMKKYENKTVVDIVLDGASEDTLETLKTAMVMSVGDTFLAEAAEEDRVAMLNTGYLYDLYPSFEEVPEGIILTYHLLENPVLTDVKIVGNEVESDETLYGLVTLRKGVILNNVTMHNNIQAIQDQYRRDGYLFAKITDINFDRDGVLTLKINEGKLEGYKVKGNTKTKERVILREMRTKVGEPFNAKLARRSMQRLNNLGFFEDVNLKPTPGVEPNAVILEIDVKEKRTGSFGIGAGYSTSDGIIGMVSVSDTNFRGRGDAISLMYEHSGDDDDAQGFVFSYRHPWIDSKETAGTIKIYDRRYEYSDYGTDGNLIEEYMRQYTGGEFTLSRPSSEYTTNYITFRNRDDKYKRHEGGPWDRSTAAFRGWRDYNFGTTRSVILQHVTDTRDNIYNPTMGSRVSLTGEVAGLGGDFDFQKVSADGARFYPLGRSQVLAVRGMIGAGHGHISEFNMFRLGGQDSLRGYRDDQFRGSKALSGSIEYRFPVANKVQGAVFTDFGSAWSDGWSPKRFHASIGLGVALNTPLGPLRLDYGRGSQGGRFHFSVGNTF